MAKKIVTSYSWAFFVVAENVKEMPNQKEMKNLMITNKVENVSIVNETFIILALTTLEDIQRLIWRPLTINDLKSVEAKDVERAEKLVDVDVDVVIGYSELCMETVGVLKECLMFIFLLKMSWVGIVQKINRS